MKKTAAVATSRESDKFILRLPDGMRKHLAKVAERNGRSMNAEVVTALARYFEHENASPKKMIGARHAEPAFRLELEPAIRELLANQQQTLELVKKMIQSPIAPKK
jgi:hypothetical protein